MSFNAIVILVSTSIVAVVAIPLRQACMDQRPQFVGCPFWIASGWLNNMQVVYEQRYYYNASTGCQPFQFFYLAGTSYSCMSNNYNNFESQPVCRSACMFSLTATDPTTTTTTTTTSQSPTERCLQNLASGICRAYNQAYGYDRNLRKCVQFMYTGCMGNSNRFGTLAECQRTCENVVFNSTETVIKCPPGMPETKCFAEPCRVKKCPSFPTAVCLNDYCGGCHARYYIDDREIDCSADPEVFEVPPPPLTIG